MRSRIAAGRGKLPGGTFRRERFRRHPYGEKRCQHDEETPEHVWLDGCRIVDAHRPQFRYFPDHIVFGSSAFDEASQIPISPEDVAQLSDPSLTTPEFHELDRRLTGEDRRLPTYLK